MKDINKLIRHYVLEIVFTIAVVIISIPVWSMLNKDDTASIAKSYATMDYLYLNIDKYVESDEFKDVISIINDTNTLRGYDLILKIRKENANKSTKVLINNKEYTLENLDKTYDKDYVYYNIKTGTLIANKENVVLEYKNTNIGIYDVNYEIIENHEV